MRVSEKDDQLILRTSWSSLFGPIGIGLFIVVLAAGIFWQTERETTFNCKRLEINQIQCELHQMFLGQTIKQATVNDPQHAIVQVQHSSKGGTSYRVAFVTAQGTVPLTDYYSSDAPADDLAEQFNQFRQDAAAKSVLLDQPASGFGIVFMVMMAGFGAVLILVSHYDTFVFDRYRDTLTFTRVGLTGVHTREESLSGLQAEVRQFRGSKGRRYYRVYLLLDNGSTIKMDWNTSRISAAQHVVDQIQDFVRPGVHIQYANA